MINNLDIIKPLLNFTDEGDFYMLYILKRKKDQPKDERDNHQSSRTIKMYCIDSLDYLESKYEEIIQLSELFKARVYIHIQKQNHKYVALDMMMLLAERIKNGQHNQNNLFESVVGKSKRMESRWIVDIDDKDEKELAKTIAILDETRPQGNKVEAVIPTKSGYHLITKRFDVDMFRKSYPQVDIQRKNPTLLYFPNSLD
jgi:hypothetical protein